MVRAKGASEPNVSALIERMRKASPRTIERTMKALDNDNNPIEGHTGEVYHFTPQSLARAMEYGSLVATKDSDSAYALMILTCDEFRAEPDRAALLESIKELHDNAGLELLQITNAVNGFTTQKREPDPDEQVEVSKVEQAAFRGPEIV